MAHELHKVGYQRLRISPGLSPSGLHWRCPITYADNIGRDGFTILDFDVEAGKVAFYTSPQGTAYFDWPDAATLSARALARTFLGRFPVIARFSVGEDWPYAGWLTDVLGWAEQGRWQNFPVLYADYDLPADELRLPPPPLGNSPNPG
jgi:hypothetical protein